ncbi:MAG: hypothetical protein M3092_05855 [Actinomycetia bacterium]|nr:hypothetical protein [Actinomycetes bacterium]
MTQTPQSHKARRWGAGTAAVTRSLIRLRRPVSGKELALHSNITQPRSVQILQILDRHGGIERTDEGIVGHTDRLFELYLAHTLPTVQSESYWYAPSAVMVQAQDISATMGGMTVGFSADIACDLLAPWRNPTLGILYSNTPIEIDPSTFVAATGISDATIVVRVVSDMTLFPRTSTPPEWSWTPEIRGIPIIDPIQQWHDLLTLGGEDRGEAAVILKSTITGSTPP